MVNSKRQCASTSLNETNSMLSFTNIIAYTYKSSYSMCSNCCDASNNWKCLRLFWLEQAERNRFHTGCVREDGFSVCSVMYSGVLLLHSISLLFIFWVLCTNYHYKHVYILYKQKSQLCENSALLVPESPCNHRAYVKCINTSGSIILPSLKGMNITHS